MNVSLFRVPHNSTCRARPWNKNDFHVTSEDA